MQTAYIIHDKGPKDAYSVDTGTRRECTQLRKQQEDSCALIWPECSPTPPRPAPLHLLWYSACDAALDEMELEEMKSNGLHSTHPHMWKTKQHLAVVVPSASRPAPALLPASALLCWVFLPTD